jgi:hypothetical protein
MDPFGDCTGSLIDAARNQDQGRAATRCGKRLVEVHARHFGEVDVEDQTRVRIGNVCACKTLGRANALTLKPETSNSLRNERRTEGSSSTKITSGLLSHKSSSRVASGVAMRSSIMTLNLNY